MTDEIKIPESLAGEKTSDEIEKDQAVTEKDLDWEPTPREHTAILDDEGNNSLIEGALQMMNSAEGTADAIKAKKVGLELVQIGWAELQALRLARYATSVIELEEKMYNMDAIRELKKPSQVIDYMNRLNGSVQEATKCIQSTLTRAKFDSVEVFLREIVENNGTTKEGEGHGAGTPLGKNAKALLDKITSGTEISDLLGDLDQEDQEVISSDATDSSVPQNPSHH